MRLLFISNEFPNRLDPTKSTFNQEMIRALAMHHAIHVISPIAWFDTWRYKATDQSSSIDGCDGYSVSYPRFYYTPKMLRNWYGSFMWHSMRGHCRQMISKYRPEAILSYWAHPDGEVAVRAARMAGVPAVVMVGGSDVLLLTQSAGRRRRILDVLASADGIIAVSHDLKASLERLGVDPGKVCVIHRGVDARVFSPGEQTEARRRLMIPAKERVILWVGRMVPVKGLDVLLEASDLLRERSFEHSIYLVGGGPLRRSLETTAKARGLAWKFVGEIAHHQLAEWYRAADVTALPSRSEGVPNVLRESQACGTPFVATCVGGVREIADARRDRLVPSADPPALADSIAAVLTADRGELSPSRSPVTWTESAARITEFLEAVVSDYEKRPRVSLAAGPSRLRQLARRTLVATLPRRLFLVRGSPDRKAVCLTFDDGPHEVETPRLLDALGRHKVRATFFIVGERAEKYPALVRRIADEGHVIGHHSYTHSDPASTSADQLLAEVSRTQDLLARLVGRSSNLFRPPWGKLTMRKFWKLSRGGYRVVLWNNDPKDYASRSPDDIRAWFARRSLASGDVVLMHDTHPHATDVLPDLATRAQSAGLSFETVDEWMK